MATSVFVSSSDRAEARARLSARLYEVRAQTLSLAAPLSPEDQQAQSMADASPTIWHLAHTTWFFETFVLAPNVRGFEPFDPSFGYLFNSYYEAVGPRHPRPARGLLTRPALDRVLEWRAHTDAALSDFMKTASDDTLIAAAPMIDLGVNHEEQHQELILMDALHLLSLNPLAPAYAPPLPAARQKTSAHAWVDIEGGLVEIGHDASQENAGFAFDNEGPRHKTWFEDYALGNRLVTNGEFLDFIEAGGYREPRFWLSDGWAWVQSEAIAHPLYWRATDDGWREFGLRGLAALDPSAPVAHLSHFEADAYARFRDARLPSEAEWEYAVGLTTDAMASANLLNSGALRPTAARGNGLRQTIGDLWEWTRTAYSPYPGFRAAEGAIGEYNGKFMSGQMVLRGGSFATSQRHIRASYRNFFYPHQRWMFSGLRLARDV